jgi:cobalt-zinc-cadmium efflux system protein
VSTHEHGHIEAHYRGEGRLALSLYITIFIMAGEVAAGFISNSLALLSDAGHMFTDAFALGLSLVAARITRRSPDYRATFGYQRVGLLAAVINGGSLFAMSFVIFYEAYRRLSQPPHINAALMLVAAGVGLAANLVMAYILRHGHHDLNLKSAWLHVLGDALASVGVIISGVIIALTGWTYADPIASVLIGGIILLGGWRVVSEATLVFLELAPREHNPEEIVKELCDMPEVLGVHDVHIWSVTHGQVAFTAHVWVHDQAVSKSQEVSEKIKKALEARGISHVTLEFQCVECEGRGIYCETHPGE